MQINFNPIIKHVIGIEGNKEVAIADNHVDVPSNKEIKILSMPDANEAFMRNEKKDPNTAIITFACGADDSNSVCVHKSNCPILDRYDEIIYQRLEKNEIIGIEVRWCGKYESRNKWSNMEV
jgi:hypothetical protein